MNIWITGPESCGKTELAQFLALQLEGGRYVEEYARVYLEQKLPSLEYSYDDLKHIVDEQISRWEIELSNPQHHHIFDGDIIVLKIWVEEVYGEVWSSIERWLNNFSPDILLLCKPDVPWVSDPLRTNPNDRDRLFDKYIFYLNKYRLAHEIIHGNFEEREKKAMELVRSRFAVDKTEEA